MWCPNGHGCYIARHDCKKCGAELQAERPVKRPAEGYPWPKEFKGSVVIRRNVLVVNITGFRRKTQ